MKPLTIREFFKKYPGDNTYLEHVMKARYGNRMFVKNVERNPSLTGYIIVMLIPANIDFHICLLY